MNSMMMMVIMNLNPDIITSVRSLNGFCLVTMSGIGCFSGEICIRSGCCDFDSDDKTTSFLKKSS
ncbi:hypothetical protein ZOSMA_35G00020 [Zostera marina]|uniref:Uncharacterized protein n=1 Tax=Zostera marina TaxID=29655 RepID=A0A0K9P6A5_ZOSMR|nr:hypothetical protein ZOSMA_35G00020 [Zostera marina]